MTAGCITRLKYIYVPQKQELLSVSDKNLICNTFLSSVEDSEKHP